MLLGGKPQVDGYPERHPCEMTACPNTVQYDDEPFCYTHSPDSGSDIPGYSYAAKHPK